MVDKLDARKTERPSTIFIECPQDRTGMSEYDNMIAALLRFEVGKSIFVKFLYIGRIDGGLRVWMQNEDMK